MGDLRITLKKSVIGTKPKQRATARALGLRRIRQTVVHPDRPEIRGMVARIPHLVDVEEVPGPEGSSRAGNESP
ncbi:MAG TPA: 50S ribosomal protein L30 [Acidimicrobiia bacterium]|nr:50S ribosomal protein L30 [Acidimicrobiia bacterium]